MSNKRSLAVTVLALLGMLGIATTSLAALRAPAGQFSGCGQSCANGQSCTNPRCPCNQDPITGQYVCEIVLSKPAKH